MELCLLTSLQQLADISEPQQAAVPESTPPAKQQENNSVEEIQLFSGY